MKYLTLLLIAMISLASSCQKDPEPTTIPYPFNVLPPATQSGENTFGCLINGEPWVAYAPWNPFGGRFRGTYDEEHYGYDYNRRIWLSALRQFPTKDLMNDSISSSLLIDIRAIPNVGYYDKNNLEITIMSFSSSRPPPTKIYNLDTLAPFQVHITRLDTVKKIVSGTFEMDLIEIDDPFDILHIRHGRFDALYEPR